ncbi:5,10-methylenetetrahydrofolate reductase [Friedmanniella luteola]|uniref:Methylenetetrahydrofolate reductase n=1 Tax=Friedmanniella luteola TaxID=546871 RepID=A0A1H2A0Q6_9ACTN|nr:methylenetetrahydrofolate reductase C-terminal domain-containing protein [Friedmanniella luteola]SDT39534.1 5,10-methylenetetrahydrofolate reductase [Friedmanniella luteola]
MRTGCPKRMVHGPCGGVRPDGRCEVAEHPCVFLDLPEPPPVTPVAGTPPAAVPEVLTDLSVPPSDRATLTRTARRLAGSADALLVGDHQDRPDFSPSLLARLIAEAGVRPWVTLACRERPRAALEAELDRLRADGLATVVCVTGDGRRPEVATAAPAVFDLDGTRLAGLAAARGLPVAVPEAPAAPPRGLRPQRLVRKQQAGAAVAVLNHVGRPEAVAAFVAAARTRGLTMPVVAAVAVFTDERSAAALAALPGLELDRAAVAAVLARPDPVEAGIRVAVAEARALLAVEGVAGVNLSGLASGRGTAFAADVQAEIGTRIRDGRAVRG